MSASTNPTGILRQLLADPGAGGRRADDRGTPGRNAAVRVAAVRVAAVGVSAVRAALCLLLGIVVLDLAGCYDAAATAAGAAGAAKPLQSWSLGATIHGLNASGLVLMVDVEQTLAAAQALHDGWRAPAQRWQIHPPGVPCACELPAARSVDVPVGATSQLLAGSLPTGTRYAVGIQAQPSGERCSLAEGSGTIGSSNVSSVTVSCTDQSYSVGGSISGLTASGLVLQDNGADALSVGAGATQFTMPTPIPYASPYAVTVQAAPTGLVCSVSNGAGVMGAGAVTSVTVGCLPNFQLLYAFVGGSSDGAQPYHSLIQARDGTLYGTTLKGGSSAAGTIWSIDASGTESLLYAFSSIPYSGLTQASDGNLYGTTASGGANGRGTVFAITPSGSESLLYSFPAGGSEPYTGVIQARDGNFYGTTGANGKNDDGTVFEMTPAGAATVLHVFPKGTTSDGQIPYAGLIQGSDGNFYGTTYDGGSHGLGTVFEVTANGSETVLYSFAGGGDGANPYAGVIQGSDGDLYGTTYNGGAGGVGTVYRLIPGGAETVLYAFAGGSTDGANPEAGVIQGSDGNLYGTTYDGGAGGVGTVYGLTLGGAETLLHSFASGSDDGANPTANLVLGGDGNLYGSTYAGGGSDDGTVYRVLLH
jgi:uncharacterized repeat protein (TIGR03803 family)